MASSIGDIIATAIRKADRRYFSEDYAEQATAVLIALERRGYVIVPKEPTQPMLKAARDSLVYGINKSRNVVYPIWRAMVDASATPAE